MKQETKKAVNPKKKKLKRAVNTNTETFYVTNAELLEAIIEAKEVGYVTDKLIRLIKNMAERYSRKHSFYRYTNREDMVAHAVANLCKHALRFDTSRKNAFSYYTTAITNSFIQCINVEKAQREIRDALLVEAGANPSFNFMEKEKDEADFELSNSDDIEYLEEKCKFTVGSDDELVPEYVPTLAESRFLHRAPGPVTTYGPDDLVIDEATGSYVLKKDVQNG